MAAPGAEAATFNHRNRQIAAYEAIPLGPRGQIILDQLNYVRALHGYGPIAGRRGWCQRSTAIQLANTVSFHHNGCDSVLALGSDIYDFGRAWNESLGHRELILQATSAKIASAQFADGRIVAVVELRY